MLWGFIALTKIFSHSQFTYVQKPVPAEIWAMFVWYIQSLLNIIFSSSAHRDAHSVEHSNKKGKAILVTVLGGPQVCETWRFPHFPDNRLTNGGEAVSLMHRQPFTPRKIPGTHSWETFAARYYNMSKSLTGAEYERLYGSPQLKI
jgi:hypothetical protein